MSFFFELLVFKKDDGFEGNVAKQDACSFKTRVPDMEKRCVSQNSRLHIHCTYMYVLMWGALLDPKTFRAKAYRTKAHRAKARDVRARAQAMRAKAQGIKAK